MARYGRVITNMKNPVMALYGADLQIAVEPMLRCTLDWQKHLQLSMEKRWTNKRVPCWGMDSETHLYPTYGLIDLIDSVCPGQCNSE